MHVAIVAGLLLGLGAGCATTHATKADDEGVTELDDGDRPRKGVLHVVRKGQTLYRIAKTYAVPLQDLAEVNDIADPAQIRVGMALWIPGADRVRDVPASFRPVAPTPAITKPEVPKPAPPKPAPPKPDVPKTQEKRPDPDDLPPPPPPPEDDDDAPPEAKKVVLQRSRFAWPIDGKLSSGFGTRGDGTHDGIDLLAPKGTPVHAADAGLVLFAGEQRGYGNLVLLKHPDGLVTVYAHHSENRVKAGDVVTRGQVVGLVGRTGRATTDHLHFEVRVDRRPRNPLFFLPERK